MTFTQPPYWWNPVRAIVPHPVPVLAVPPEDEPISLDEAKLRAGFEWAAGDAREGLLRDFIAAARSKVERDTGLALLTQTWDVYFDALPGGIITLPVRPLASMSYVKSTDEAGVVTTIDPTQYLVDLAGARVGLPVGAVWPTNLRSFQPFVIRVVAGWTSAELLKAAHPLLVHAVGLLTAHYATLGRDLASIDATTEVPFGYEDAIAGYLPVSVI